MYVVQKIANTVTEPAVSWFTETVLDTPTLLYPADTAKYCPPITPKLSQNTGVDLQWDAVTGATFYILQLSLGSQQFSGPGLRSIKVATNSYELKYIDDIRMGQTVYWRVFAHNNVGGQSLSSPVRSLSLECPGFDGLGKNPEDPAASIDTFSCDSIGADLKIIGATTLRKGETERVFVLDVSYDCKDINGLEISITDVVWELDLPDPDVGTDPVATISSQNDQYVTLTTSSTLVKPHSFGLKVTVTFELLNTITSVTSSVECSKTKRVLVEGLGTGVVKLRHAIVTELCSSECNTYRVRIVNRGFDESCGTGTGTGTTTSTGS